MSLIRGCSAKCLRKGELFLQSYQPVEVKQGDRNHSFQMAAELYGVA